MSDVRAWTDAKTTNTLESYSTYLRNFPQGEFRELAEQKRKTIELKNADYTDWQQSKQLNTKAAYEKYLRNHLEGDYRELAETALQRLTPFIQDNMLLIPGGSFQMGSNDGESDEKPVHSVSISSFYLSKYEVTVEEFKQFIDATGYQTDADKGGGSEIWNVESWENKSGINWKYDVEGKLRPSTNYKHPVIYVSWNDATAYCKWLSQKTGLTYRLPTEAEWEYAARGGMSSNYIYAGSNTEDEVAWYVLNSKSTHPVGQKKANELGLYDMSGNVWEWCQDWYDSDYYSKSSFTNPQGPDKGSSRIARGGSWRYYLDVLRVANRNRITPDYRRGDIGFRLARQQ